MGNDAATANERASQHPQHIMTALADVAQAANAMFGCASIFRDSRRQLRNVLVYSIARGYL
jgi:hypothetical protein